MICNVWRSVPNDSGIGCIAVDSGMCHADPEIGLESTQRQEMKFEFAAAYLHLVDRHKNLGRDGPNEDEVRRVGDCCMIPSGIQPYALIPKVGLVAQLLGSGKLLANLIADACLTRRSGRRANAVLIELPGAKPLAHRPIDHRLPGQAIGDRYFRLSSRIDRVSRAIRWH